jgi:hypothetical protein
MSIEIPEYRTRTTVIPFESGSIQITTELLRRDPKTQVDNVVLLTREIINTKEDRVKQALIELGWTPPVEK